jgi:hypothetical protein
MDWYSKYTGLIPVVNTETKSSRRADVSAKASHEKGTDATYSCGDWHHVIYASVKNIQYKIPLSPSLSSAVSLVFARILY